MVPYITLLLVLGLFIWQIKVLDIDDPDQCLSLFKFNSKIGFVIFIGLVIGLFLS
jgi:4-hydroxybenzoate polyprenyltransferase